MDYNNYKIQSVKEIECLENETDNISLTNSMDIGTNNLLNIVLLNLTNIFKIILMKITRLQIITISMIMKFLKLKINKEKLLLMKLLTSIIMKLQVLP